MMAVEVVVQMTVLRPESWSKAPRGWRGRGLVLLAAWLVVSALAGPALAEGVQVGIGPVSVGLPAPPSAAAAAGSVSTPPVEASVQTPVAEATVQVSQASVALDRAAGMPSAATVSTPAVETRLSSPLVRPTIAPARALRAAVPPDSSVASWAAKGATPAEQPSVAARALALRSASKPVSIPARRAATGSPALPARRRALNPAVHAVGMAATTPAPQRSRRASSQVAVARAATGVAAPLSKGSTWDDLIRASTAAVGASGSAGGAGGGVAALAGLVLLLAIGVRRFVLPALNVPAPAWPVLALERPG
jgi:hypothetical protein